MAQRSGDHECLPRKRLIPLVLPGAFRRLLDVQFREQPVHGRIVLLRREVPAPGVGQHLADPFRLHQFLRAGVAHRVEIVAEMAAQYLGVRQADPRHAQAVDQTDQRRVRGPLDGLHQIIVGSLAESFHLHDRVPVPVQMEDIGVFMDKTGADEFLQGHLRQPVDVQCVAADQQRKTLDLLRLTFRIRAIEGLHVILLANDRPAAADRTDLRDIAHAAPRQVIGDLGNDHVGFIDRDPVARAQFKGLQDTDIVDAGPAHRGPLQFHGVEHRHRIDQPRSGRTPLDMGKPRFRDLVGPLKGNRIAGKFGRAPQGFAVGDIVVGQHQTVRGNVVAGHRAGEPGHRIRDRIRRNLSVLHHLETLLPQPFELAHPGIAEIHAVRRDQREDHAVDVAGRCNLTV